MSPTNFSATAGLTVLGLVFGPAATLMMAFGADPRTDAGTAAPAAFHAPTAPPPNAEREYSVLLKTSGQVIQGKITKTETGYRLRTKVGEIPYGRREVEAVFGTLAEAYEYKNSRTPSHDPDERMKLAQWCLTNGLTDHAKVELERVLELNPQHHRAKGMLFQMDAVASREPKVDGAVVRSSVEMPLRSAPSADPNAPGVLNLDDLREKYRRNPNGAGVPVIFDLPAPQAIRRYQQFAQRVHPILQKQCAGCHNERTPGSFPLFQAKNRRDLGNDFIIRANLDATLRLINPDDPAKSEVLTSSLMPHPPKNQPIFLGPNQFSYRELSAWVMGLKSSPEPVDPAIREASYQPGAEGAEEAFAVDRRPGVEAPMTSKPQRSAPRLNLNADRPDPQFPTDPLLGGPDAAKIKLRAQPQPGDVGAAPTVTTNDDGAPVMKVNGVEIPIDTRADPRKSSKSADPAAKKSKPKLDPAALQRLMELRNGAR